MNITEFFLKWNNKFLDADNAAGFQCVDVIKQYFKEVLGLFPRQGNAIDYWKEIPGFVKINKTWYNRPNPGDIIVFNIGEFGHIAICNWSRFFDFGGFEQNFPIGSPCHYQHHPNYVNVLGWLRPPIPIAEPTLKVPLTIAKVNLVPLLFPKVPLKIVRFGTNLLPPGDFMEQVWKYSFGKITCNIRDYDVSLTNDLTQEMVYNFLNNQDLKEKFVFMFYPGDASQVFYKTYSYPAKDCEITTCPASDPRLLAFEFSHQLQQFYNDHRGSLPAVEVEDSNFPSDDLIYKKYNSVVNLYL